MRVVTSVSAAKVGETSQFGQDSNWLALLAALRELTPNYEQVAERLANGGLDKLLAEADALKAKLAKTEKETRALAGDLQTQRDRAALAEDLLRLSQAFRPDMTDGEIANNLHCALRERFPKAVPLASKYDPPAALLQQARESGTPVAFGDLLAVPLAAAAGDGVHVEKFVLLQKESAWTDAQLDQVRQYARSASRALTDADIYRLDPGTGLARRDGIVPYAKETLEDHLQQNRPLSLLMLDIDKFKNINTRLTHVGGNEVLREMAQVTRRVLTEQLGQPEARLARYGGEEFVVLLPGVDEATARDIAERLPALVARATAEENRAKNTLGPSKTVMPTVTFSVGAASLDKGPKTGAEAWAQLVGEADKKLFEAKDDGRNRARFQPSKLLEEVGRRLGLDPEQASMLLSIQEFRDPLKTDRLDVGAEALLRRKELRALLNSLGLSPKVAAGASGAPSKSWEVAFSEFDAAAERLKAASSTVKAENTIVNQATDAPFVPSPASVELARASLALNAMLREMFVHLRDSPSRAKRLESWDKLSQRLEAANGKTGYTAKLREALGKAVKDPEVIDTLRSLGVSERELKRMPGLFDEAARLLPLSEATSAVGVIGAPRFLTNAERDLFIKPALHRSAAYAREMDLAGPDVIEFIDGLRYEPGKREAPLRLLFDAVAQGTALVSARRHRGALSVNKIATRSGETPSPTVDQIIRSNTAAYASDAPRQQLIELICGKLEAWVGSEA